MKARQINDEVIVAEGGIVQVRAADVAFLAERARQNTRRRARLCAHPDARDRLHEMLIVLDRETYIRPHRHAGKSESFHIIEGELDVVIFHDDGSVRDVVSMGPFGSGRAFYYRLMENCFHTVLIRTPFALFHETTNGPFNRSDTEFAAWSPAEGEPQAQAFMAKMRALIEGVGSMAA
jgi:cupin fold WbuC family metalloprotein